MTALITQRQILFFFAFLFFLKANSQQNSFEFIENKGQWHSRARFMGEVGSGAFFLENKGFTVLLHNPSDLQQIMHRHHHIEAGGEKQVQKPSAVTNNAALPPGPDGIRTSKEGAVLRSHAYRVSFLGANENAAIMPEKPEDYHNNYLLGNDPSKWASNCKIYRAVEYKNIYPGIDIRYYSENGHLKYDFILAAGVNPGIIAMRYEGADKLTVKNGELYISTSVGQVKELAPYTYQFDREKGRTEISCKFQVVDGNTVKFNAKNYDPSLPLIIDPNLEFSTFTGGPDNWGFTATPGPGGTFFSGSVIFSNGFPVTPGAFQTTFGGGAGNRQTDVLINKFNPRGTAPRLYATYLGGNGNDYPHSIISDPQGNLVVTGRTYSGSNFPRAILSGPGGDADIFVAKLNAAGSGLIGSLVIGGSSADGVNVSDQQFSGDNERESILRFYGDDARSEVNLDAAGNIYIAAQTQSANFPVSASAFQPAFGGGQDGAALKINPNCNAILFSSFLGGSGDDGAFVVDINPLTNDIYVGGATRSSNFPGNKTGVWQGAFQGGGSDGYLSIISNDGTSLLRSTFLGTGGYDAVYGVKFDRFGFPYVMGISEGSWPVINATYSNAGSHQFVAKLPNSLGAPIYSTIFGTASTQPNISPVAFLVDRCENVYISGWGGWLFPAGPSGTPDPYGMAGVVGMPVTPDAIKGSGINQTDDRDFYFIVIKRNAESLLYGSCFGQNGGDGEHVDGGTSRFDAQGVIYQAICANCGGSNGGRLPITLNYPISPGAVSPVNGGLPGGCNLGALKIAFNYAGVDGGVRAVINGTFDTSGCVPLTVTFRDTVQNAKSYEWDFDGDGTTDLITSGSQFEAPFTYNAVGNYRLRLIAVDSTTCNIRDTSYITVRVRNDEAFPDFITTKASPDCLDFTYIFNNSGSVPAPGKPFRSNSFLWDFGDNTPRIPAGIGPISHTFARTGTYLVKLILIDTNYCNAPDTLERPLRVASFVRARFNTPQSGCAPHLATFENVSEGGQTFVWDFGDGTSSTDPNPPPKLYATPGNYVVTLTATDPFTCNVTDVSPPFTIAVKGSPTASFTFSPVTPQENFPYTFTNTSTPDAVRFKWLFGDGDSLLTISRAPVEHQYNATGTFIATLIAYNDIGCPDTFRTEVQNIVVPKLDVPNAFTPAGPNNNIIFIRGFGIGRMRWRIYSRFGNLVFESNSRNLGWDGRYKGALLPMDVYAYTLEVEFTDGTRATKKGDITLLR